METPQSPEAPAPARDSNAELREWLASLKPAERASLLTREELEEVDNVETETAAAPVAPPVDAPPEAPPTPPSGPPETPLPPHPGILEHVVGERHDDRPEMFGGEPDADPDIDPHDVPLTHNGVDGWACPDCDAVFSTEIQLRGHKIHHNHPRHSSPKMVTCPYCEQQFKELGLNIHLPVCPRNPNPGKRRRGRPPGSTSSPTPRRRQVEVALQPGAVTDDQLLEIIASISGTGASIPITAIGKVYTWVAETQDLLDFIREASKPPPTLNF